MMMIDRKKTLLLPSFFLFQTKICFEKCQFNKDQIAKINDGISPIVPFNIRLSY